MPLSQKELEDDGVPVAFLRGDSIEVRDGLSGSPLRAPVIPLDGRTYICAGEITLNNGQRLAAHFELDTSKKRPFIKDSLWCTPDAGKVWYLVYNRADLSDLLDMLSLTRANAFPLHWRPARPLQHRDPGPYPIDWTPAEA